LQKSTTKCTNADSIIDILIQPILLVLLMCWYCYTDTATDAAYTGNASDTADTCNAAGIANDGNTVDTVNTANTLC
jgi:hypothetical protein